VNVVYSQNKLIVFFFVLGIWLTLNRTHAVLLVYNFNVIGAPIKDETLCIVVSGVNINTIRNGIGLICQFTHQSIYDIFERVS
jgi:hypothetical protein